MEKENLIKSHLELIEKADRNLLIGYNGTQRVYTPLVFGNDIEKSMLLNVIKLVFAYYEIKAYTISFESYSLKSDNEEKMKEYEEYAKSNEISTHLDSIKTLLLSFISEKEKLAITYLNNEIISETDTFDSQFSKFLPDFELSDVEKKHIEDLINNSFSGLVVEDFSYGL